ncbi:centromere protein Mis12 [Purpureocillium lavendulum]|uniref:Centromere protein Mis12 n=1 Tax=Purpureocillium lavendulum TaxID=1247861 RepID=A0AB34FTF3_9HYPO|nr:centromere protein Mis12 [Purpureocillium lavendulum]
MSKRRRPPARRAHVAAMTAPASNSNSDYELLTEHLGYAPVALIDDIINTVNVLADRALDSVERLLLSIPPQKLGFKSSSSSSGHGKNSMAKEAGDDGGALPPDEAAKREIENGTHQLETLLNASIDKNFDLFELYTMRNILSVRPADQPYLRLAHYQGLDLTAATGDDGDDDDSKHHRANPDRPTSASVNALRRRLQASQRLHAALEAERARNDVLLRRLRGVLGERDDGGDGGKVKKEDIAGASRGGDDDDGESASRAPLSFLREKGTLADGGTDQPITTTAEFALSQLQPLRSLSASLRTLLPDLGPPEEQDTAAAATSDENDERGGARGNGRSWRRQRAEYIEASSRKYLERAGGLELGPRGEVRDGDWQGQGRALGRDEVEGLERAAAALAARGEGGSGSGDAGSSARGRRGEGEDDAMDES